MVFSLWQFFKIIICWFLVNTSRKEILIKLLNVIAVAICEGYPGFEHLVMYYFNHIASMPIEPTHAHTVEYSSLSTCLHRIIEKENFSPDLCELLQIHTNIMPVFYVWGQVTDDAKCRYWVCTLSFLILCFLLKFPCYFTVVVFCFCVQTS